MAVMSILASSTSMPAASSVVASILTLRPYGKQGLEKRKRKVWTSYGGLRVQRCSMDAGTGGNRVVLEGGCSWAGSTVLGRWELDIQV